MKRNDKIYLKNWKVYVIMEKEKIKRKELKSNFLRQMIIRVDYDYLFDEDIENIVKKRYKELIESGYKMNSKTLAEYNINVNINNITEEENNSVSMKNNNKEEYSSFKKENIVIDITRNFATITDEYKKFESFEAIVSDFSKIIEEIRNVREGLEIKRIGIRKINSYLFKDINRINDYFEPTLFSFNELEKNEKSLMVKQTIESFKYKDYKINELGNISKGIITNPNGEKFDAYQVVLDIDVYNDKDINEKINLEEMNNIVFEVYKSALNINFLENLKKENYEDEVIIKNG